MTRNVVIIAFLPEINSHYFVDMPDPLTHPASSSTSFPSACKFRFNNAVSTGMGAGGFTAFRLWPFLGAIKLYLQLSFRRDDERDIVINFNWGPFPCPGQLFHATWHRPQPRDINGCQLGCHSFAVPISFPMHDRPDQSGTLMSCVPCSMFWLTFASN